MDHQILISLGFTWKNMHWVLVTDNAKFTFNFSLGLTIHIRSTGKDLQLSVPKSDIEFLNLFNEYK